MPIRRRGAIYFAVSSTLTSQSTQRCIEMFGARTIPALRTALTMLVALAVVSACGASGTGSPATPSGNQSKVPEAAESPPPVGGPVPLELRGEWVSTDQGSTGPRLTLSANSYQGMQGSTGSVVVNGDEMDLYKSPACVADLGYDAVGRYRWTLIGGVLTFTPMNDDPCDRKYVFTGSFKLFKPA